MGLNVGEASNVFVLLEYLMPSLVERQTPADERPTAEDAKCAAIALAEAAHKSLSAGPFGTQVKRAWSKCDPGPRRG